MHVVNIGYRSTNYWVVTAGRSRLLIDLGWPGTMGRLLAQLRRLDVPLAEIKYAVATHYHIDHAGLGEELKRAGVPLLVLEQQVEAISLMRQHTKPQDNYVDIQPKGNIVVPCADSRQVLAAMGIEGEIVPTPGHSPDSVSVLLDDGRVFTGDLPSVDRMAPHEEAQSLASWQRLQERGATLVHPGHGPIRTIQEMAGHR